EGAGRAGRLRSRRLREARGDGPRPAGVSAGDPRVQAILDQALAAVASASTTADLEQLRVRVLGRAGELTTLLRSLGSLPAAERPRVGQEANRAKGVIEGRIAERLEALRTAEHRQALRAERPDLTLPGRRVPMGAVHPITRVLDEIIEIFAG